MSLAIRWTIGDVSSRGFDVLALSIAGARNVFGASARYIVCVNTVPVSAARAKAGEMGDAVEWLDCTGLLPEWLRPWLDTNLAGGVAWKFAPLRLCLESHVLSLDNDVILWDVPPAVRAWLEEPDSFLIGEDVAAFYGHFAPFCPREPRNAGIVGLPPLFDPEPALRQLLEAAGVLLSSETDEQGLQAALITSRRHRVVPLSEVSISGYFRPHLLELGSCGAHFVGVNVKDFPYAHGFWDGYKEEVAAKVHKPAPVLRA